jgi:quercetin dioxygenase-like cupin family protein
MWRQPSLKAAATDDKIGDVLLFARRDDSVAMFSRGASALMRKPNRILNSCVKPIVLILLLGSIAVATLIATETTAAQTAAAPASAPSESLHVKYAPPGEAEVLGTTFVDWDALAVRTTANGELRVAFDNPTATLEKLDVHVTTVNPGMASHPVHDHAWEELILVKDGDFDVSINGVKRHAGPGYLVFFASHDAHNMVNSGSTPASYYVINFVTDKALTVPDEPAAEQAVPGMLASTVIDCDSIPSAPSPMGPLRANVIDSPTLTFSELESHISTLAVGQSTKADIVDPGDEVLVVKSGVMEAHVNGVAARISAGSFFYCAPNDKRTYRNIGTVPLVYQVFKAMSDKSPK